MPEPDKKPIVHLVPAILTGAAALIASLTAVYVNVRNDRAADAARPGVAAPAVRAAPAATVPKPPERFVLRLERIAVRHDGAMGSADWRFTIETDDEPLMALVSDDLDDSGGRNVALPIDVAGTLRVATANGSRIAVKAWHSRRFRFGAGAPDATGEGRLSRDGGIAPLHVVAAEPANGEFVFYFSATPEPR
ncbi:MAG: hypothetical protein ACREO8_01855 [Luteimonas sp.]